jgi:hypothetical protein
MLTSPTGTERVPVAGSRNADPAMVDSRTGAVAVGAKQTIASSAVAIDTFEDRHFTLAELAAAWKISHEKARRLFQHEPGVVRFHGASARGKREYNTYRIPASVARRVRLRLMNP